MASKTKVTPQKEGAPEKEGADTLPDCPLLDLSDAAVNLTASQISAQISGEIARTCRTSRQQSLADCVNHSAVEGCDRVGDVTLRSQRRRLGVGNHRVGQAFRI